MLKEFVGGIASFRNLELLEQLGKNAIDFIIGSALDLFAERCLMMK